MNSTMNKRPEVNVKTSYFESVSTLELSEKTDTSHLNSFFVQVSRLHGSKTEIQVCANNEGVDGEGLFLGGMDLKDTRKFQDDILEVLDNLGIGRKIILGNASFDMVHFPNGEIGLACGKKKFLLSKKDAVTLRAFAAKIID